ncbi:MAG TPA: PD-(D/E)XK nuclease family protein [Anaeromyxobacteraceae bacterium]|nr:PD-(D/E)XK nuclease family protein [Anaeromyxobacteraceae bacterium]
MLHLLLTPTEGGTAWRHLLAEGEARAGWECVGPLGLARRLGRVLGLPTEPASAPDRVAAYAARLDRHDNGQRSYSASRKNDAFGVASFLLSLRDRLRQSGWRGRKLAGSSRLEDLAALEALAEPALPPGFPDVLGALASELEQTRLPFPVTLHLGVPRGGFSGLMLRLLDALATAGATVEEAAADAASAPETTDLGRMQRALLDANAPPAALTGDGTLLLLEADTPLEAAHLAASFARTRPLSSATIVVAGEPAALDAALARQGLPTLGLSSASPLRPHLQILPLRLALAFRPRDPFRAAELLLLPGAPLPSRVRHALLGALSEMPGIGSPAWKAAVDGAVNEEAQRGHDAGAAGADAAAGKRLAEKIDAWFGGEGWDPGQGIPTAKASALCEMVARWAGARAGAAAKDDEDAQTGHPELWAHAAAVARTLQRMLVARPPGERLSQLALAQLHDLAVGEGSDLAASASEAGRPAVCGSPGEVLPGAATAIWFGFVPTEGAPTEPWTEAERQALVAAGVTLAAPGQTRRFEAWGWRRPLITASDRVALVRWRLVGPKPIASHPLLDELRTRVVPGSLEQCVYASEHLLAGAKAPFSPGLSPIEPATPIAPRAVWHVAATALAPEGTLSASQLESLLGCPFKWALEHQAALRPGRALDIPDGNRLLGDFAHRILQDMTLGPDRLDLGRTSEVEANAWATRAFDERVGSEAAPLVRAGREVERDAARTLVAGAAAALVRHLRAGGWKVTARERDVAGTFAGKPVEGYVDLALEKEGRTALLDLKLSGAWYRRKELEEGRALQLALYASMMRDGGKAYPPAGYLILDDGQLLTTTPSAFPGATGVDGLSAHETLMGAEEGFSYWRSIFEKGVLPVLSNELEWREAVERAGGPLPDENGPARHEPPCKFCRLDTLCRVTIGREVAP